MNNLRSIILSIFIIAVLAYLGWFGYSKASNKETASFGPTSRFTDKEGGFSIDLPSNWQKLSYGGIRITAFGPQGEAIGVLVQASSLASIDEYFTQDMNIPQKYEIGEIYIGNAKAKWIIITKEDKRLTRSITFLNYFVMNKNRIYKIECGTSTEKFDEDRAKFERLVKTFMFE